MTQTMTFDLTTPAPQPFRRMNLGVIGAGWLGGTVGGNWARSGHKVMLSSRHPARLASAAQRLGDNVSTGKPADAAGLTDIVLLSVPYEPLPDISAECGDALDGKIVLDACNPPWDPSHPLAIECAAHGVGATTQRIFAQSRVVRCFSAVDATDIEASYWRSSGKLGVPLAGDDPEAVAIAAQLVYDAGCEPLIVGGLATGVSFQRNTRPFRANTTLEKLRQRFT